jgi:hypothetical protein
MTTATVVHLGRRGLFLLLFGLVYLVYGVASYLSPPPTNLWVAVWVPSLAFGISGFVALLTGVLHPRLEWLGFVCLYLTAGLWSVQYMAAWVAGVPRAWAGFVVWLLVVLILLLVSGWAEPPPQDVVKDALDQHQQEQMAKGMDRSRPTDKRARDGNDGTSHAI